MAQKPLLHLNKAHYPVTVLGYGRRIGIWFQGCAIHCKGCVSQDTWSVAGGGAIRVDHLLNWCREKAKEGLDGITISGGEPFDQPKALGALLEGFLQWRQADKLELDILCYSGYSLKTLKKRHAGILPLLDLLIPEPFIENLPEGGIWRGSANQPLVPLSPLGQLRYGCQDEETGTQKTFQIALEEGRIWMIGIPNRNDMATLEKLCASRGLQIKEASWRR